MDVIVKAPGASRPPKSSERVSDEVERLNSRMSSTLANLRDLRDRVAGSGPERGESVAAESAFNGAGFVGSVGQSLERAHRTLTEIDSVIADVTDVI